MYIIWVLHKLNKMIHTRRYMKYPAHDKPCININSDSPTTFVTAA